MKYDKLKNMIGKLEILLSDERILNSLLSDPSIRDKTLLVVGAFKIKVPLTARVYASTSGRASRRAL